MELLCKLLVVWFIFMTKNTRALQFENEITFNENCTLLWNVGTDNEVVFEVQAKTFGYIGIGFSKDGSFSNADIVVVWMHNGSGYIEDLNIGSSGTMLKNDTKQDYHLTLGYENSTHSVIRFRRKMDTCGVEDFPITGSTQHVMLFLSENDPDMNETNPFRGFFSTFQESVATTLLYNPSSIDIDLNDVFLSTKELVNDKVGLPEEDDSLFWCKMFRLLDFSEKNHLIKFEPIFDSEMSEDYLQHIILYECHDSTPKHDRLARLRGKKCHRPDFMHLKCNSIAAYWTRGSKGFTFPKDVGYPIDSRDIQFYMMETHYHNSHYQADAMDVPTTETITSDMYQNQNETANEKASGKPQMVDSSGLKIYFTLDLRQHDAGALSIGIDPNWRHMIPPGQPSVLSEGHCIGKCTEHGFPQGGINIFAILTKTQTIGKQIRLRQIRDNNETEPIIFDSNIIPNYQEFRYLPTPVKALPGDQLIAECIYDSTSRKYITLGGQTTKDEICMVFSYYYPRQDRLSSCFSQPSLSTVLRALGIEKLTYGPNPLVIAAPEELANMTIEERLATYDWNSGFDTFQDAMQTGDFKPYCWNSKFKAVQGTERLQMASPRIENVWQPFEEDDCGNITQTTIDSKGMLPKGVTILSDSENEMSNVIEDITKMTKSRTQTTMTDIKSSTNSIVVVKPNMATLTSSSWPLQLVIIITIAVYLN